jgi:endonuclease/exonuclease/phosphatase family metal-dependent hydrolase
MPLKVISTHLDLSCRHRKRTAAIAKFRTIMQPDADDLAGPESAHLEAYSARVCFGQELQSLG